MTDMQETSSDCGKTIIEFAPHLNLTDEQKEKVSNWSVMQSQIEDRNCDGFDTAKVVINGVSFIGKPENQKNFTDSGTGILQRTGWQRDILSCQFY